ncbi:MAG: hypothetical protein U9P72_00905 [Campylobacterota bacterium]|nr:hypothetical protein [Campylobacterota bacterium]
MRHIIYSNYKDILHDMERLTSSTSYKDLLSIVMNFIINTNANDKFYPRSLNLAGYKSFEKTLDELGINKDTNKTINDSFPFEKMYQDTHKSIEEILDNLEIDKEEIDEKVISQYVMKVYRKNLEDHITVEAKKILKAFDYIGFIAIFDLGVHQSLFYENDSVLFHPYFESKEYVESLDNECFVSDFSKITHFVTDENVKYMNDILSITEKKGADKTDDLITKDVLQEIKYIAYTIEKLKEKGMTTSNYNEKVTAYNKLRKKGNEVFDLSISEYFPFKNISVLYHEIDYLLSRLLLSNAQKTAFYNELSIRCKIPKVNETEELFYEKDKYTLQSHLFDESLLNGNEGEILEEDYLELCKKHNIKIFEKKPKTNDVSLDDMDKFSIKEEHFKKQLRRYDFINSKFLDSQDGKNSVISRLGLDTDTFYWYQD